MPDKYFVADTNVLVSAAIFTSSIPNRCLNKILSFGKLAYSKAALAEYSEIFSKKHPSCRYPDRRERAYKSMP